MQNQTSNTLHNAIMEAGSKDRPSMLAPGNYVQWKSRIKRYIDTKPNQELIHYCLTNPPYELGWKDKVVLNSEGNPTTSTERVFETYKNVKQDIRDQLNAKAEAVQIILTGIDNDIYSTVDACPNACEMWKAIERLKQVFELASGLKVNISKSRIMGVGVFISEGDMAINRFRERLSFWKANSLSIGGRLTLVKSVLGILPIYYLSLFKALSVVIDALETIRRRFFWGFKDSHRGISWVKWDTILDNIKSRGLGIGSLVAKNLSLLSKWKWRFYIDKTTLWYHVIREFHGEDGGFSTPMNFGNNTLFWKDQWCGSGQRLMDIFPRLFALESDKDCKVSDRWGLVNGVWGGTWLWRISPRDKSLYEIDALTTLIGDVQLVSTDMDKWTWSGDVSGVFRVRSLSKNIDNILLSDSRVGEHHICKVNIYTWRASLNRLPTRSNLATRGVTLSSSHCPFCMAEEETSVHCIISCRCVLSIWRKIWSWWNLDLPLVFLSFSVTDIAMGNVKTSGCSRTNKALNERMLKLWMSARIKSSIANWNSWISRPFDIFAS
nr:RNA-directed DNA polymerase, eukaryota, reverse transcriptase zinc-binding domain protein [Tanacetum cinerariifolium]